MSNNTSGSGISSRSVVNLTPDQVARKRALDRENQRATRAKTKERLSQLEKELSEVKTQLAAARREITTLQENAKTMQRERAQLETAIETSYLSMKSLQNPSHSSILSHLTPCSPTSIEQPQVQPAQDLRVDSFIDHSIDNTIPIAEPENSSKQVDKYSTSQWHLDFPTAQGFSYGRESWESTSFDQDWLPYLLEEAPRSGSFNDLMSIDDTETVCDQEYGTDRKASLSRRNLSICEDSDIVSIDHSPHILFDNIDMEVPGNWTNNQSSNPSKSPFQATPPNIMVETTDTAAENQPPWTLLPKLEAPTCRLDYVLGNLISTRKSFREASQQEFLDPAFPSIASLLNPAEGGDSSVSQDIVKHIVDFTGVNLLPERIAILWMFSLISRWHISSTEKNYESLPWFLRPTPIQNLRPHPLWIECIIWPEARVQIIQNIGLTQFDTFRYLCNKTLRVNWPYDASSALMLISDSKVVMNPVFEQHLRNISNWSVGQELVDAFPFLIGKVRVKEAGE